VSAFTVVMATGIVSIAAGDTGQDVVVGVLRWVGAATFVLVLVLHGARVVVHRHVSAAGVARTVQEAHA